MKKIGLILFTSVLLTLSFTSCDDEWGILVLNDTIVYALISNDYYVSKLFEYEENNKDYSYLSRYEGYDESTFKEKFYKYINDYNIYYYLAKEYWGTLKTRRDFKENIEFEVIENIDGKEISENIIFTIEIPYLKDGYNCCEFQIQTENFGIIYLLYRYNFSRSI